MNAILTESYSQYLAADRNESGTIRNPGRLEGEGLLTVYLDNLELNGCGGEVISHPDSDCYESVFDVDSDLRAELAALGHPLAEDTAAILYQVNSVGFVSTIEMTSREADKVRAEAEALAEESDCD